MIVYFLPASITKLLSLNQPAFAPKTGPSKSLAADFESSSSINRKGLVTLDSISKETSFGET